MPSQINPSFEAWPCVTSSEGPVVPWGLFALIGGNWSVIQPCVNSGMFSSQLPSNSSFLGIFYTWNLSLPLHVEIIIEPKAQGPLSGFLKPFE